MLTFRQSMRRARNTRMAAGYRQPWGWLYHALGHVEGAARWAKLKCWYKTLGRD